MAPDERARVGGRGAILAAWVLFACAIGAGEVRAQAVLPPGHEAAFAELFGPELDGGGRGVWAVRGIQIEADGVRYSLEREGGGAVAELRLVRARQDAPGPFRFVVAAEDPLDMRALASAAAVANGRWSGPSPFVDARSSPRIDRVASPRRERRRGPAYGVLAFLLAGLCLLRASRAPDPRGWFAAGAFLVAVVAYAWVADDAFITARYVDHALRGDGLVFNTGERVQGFTHPLWIAVVIPVATLLGPVDAALIVGIACTVATVGCVGWASRNEEDSSARWAIALALLIGSESFVAFSTSGLENAMAHALLAALVAARVRGAPERVWVPLAIGLVATRFDLGLFVVPICVDAWRRGARPGRSGLPGAVAFGALVAWLIFATLYYGTPVPNTFFAKTGEGLPWVRGLAYLADFASHEPFAAFVLVLGLGVGVRRRTAMRPFVVGALVYLVYVVFVGGDYMRGRFLTAPYLTAALACASALSQVEVRAVVRPIAVLGVLSLALTDRAHAGEVVNERAFHSESQVAEILHGETHPNPSPNRTLDGALGARVMARAYADDPHIDFIDAHGLTDAFIARCPPRPEARAGHVERRVPRAYFELRGDVRLLPEGEMRLRAGDPSLARELRAMQERARLEPDAQARYEVIAQITRAPLFARERLRVLPEFALGRFAVPVGADVPTHEPEP